MKVYILTRESCAPDGSGTSALRGAYRDYHDAMWQGHLEARAPTDEFQPGERCWYMRGWLTHDRMPGTQRIWFVHEVTLDVAEPEEPS